MCQGARDGCGVRCSVRSARRPQVLNSAQLKSVCRDVAALFLLLLGWAFVDDVYRVVSIGCHHSVGFSSMPTARHMRTQGCVMSSVRTTSKCAPDAVRAAVTKTRWPVFDALLTRLTTNNSNNSPELPGPLKRNDTMSSAEVFFSSSYPCPLFLSLLSVAAKTNNVLASNHRNPRSVASNIHIFPLHAVPVGRGHAMWSGRRRQPVIR